MPQMDTNNALRPKKPSDVIACLHGIQTGQKVVYFVGGNLDNCDSGVAKAARQAYAWGNALITTKRVRQGSGMWLEYIAIGTESKIPPSNAEEWLKSRAQLMGAE